MNAPTGEIMNAPTGEIINAPTIQRYSVSNSKWSLFSNIVWCRRQSKPMIAPQCEHGNDNYVEIARYR